MTFDGREITNLSRRAMRPVRREIQMIFQDPYSSLNPRRRVGSIIGDPFAIHKTATGAERKRAVQELMERVGLNPSTTTGSRPSSPAGSGSASGSPARSRCGRS